MAFEGPESNAQIHAAQSMKYNNPFIILFDVSKLRQASLRQVRSSEVL
jgi:hypothetical protein